MAGMKYRITVDLVAHGETMEQAVYALFQQAMDAAREVSSGECASAALFWEQGGQPPLLVGEMIIKPIDSPAPVAPHPISIQAVRH